MFEPEEIEKIHELEKAALYGDRLAMTQIVSMFRKLRQASETLLDSRYTDGECDASQLSSFDWACKELLDDLPEETWEEP